MTRAQLKSRSARYRWLFVSLLLTTTAVVPAAYLLVPHIHRGMMLRKLVSPDLTERERGLSYVVQWAWRDPLVLDGAMSRLGVRDEANFLHIVNALDRAGRWSHPPAPIDAWLRWLAMMAAAEGEEARVLAMHFVHDLPHMADDERVVRLCAGWMRDASADVRYNAIPLLVRMAQHAASPVTYHDMIRDAMGDSNPRIALDAWLVLGWLDRDGAVAALTQGKVEPAVVSMAAYLPHLKLDTPPPPEVVPHAITAENQIATWRALLSAAADAPIIGAFLPQAGLSALARPLSLAAAYRAKTWREPWMPEDDEVYANLIKLARAEGGHSGIDRLDEMPDLLKLAIAAGAAEPSTLDLRDMMLADAATTRDLACIVAADRIDAERQALMIRQSLNNYDDNAKMAGAMLSGLTGVETELLAKREAVEDQWVVRQVMRLGLWMQGVAVEQGSKPVDMRQAAKNMLTRPDVPATSVLLAMLHADKEAALEILLNPLADELTFDPKVINPRTTSTQRLALRQLLVDGRWSRVLYRYLPDDAPPLWLWADEQLQQIQVDALRAWWMVRGEGKFKVQGSK